MWVSMNLLVTRTTAFAMYCSVIWVTHVSKACHFPIKVKSWVSGSVQLQSVYVSVALLSAFLQQNAGFIENKSVVSCVNEQAVVGSPCTTERLIECVDVCLHISIYVFLHEYFIFIAELTYIYIQAIYNPSRNTWLSKSMVMYGNSSSYPYLSFI